MQPNCSSLLSEVFFVLFRVEQPKDNKHFLWGWTKKVVEFTFRLPILSSLLCTRLRVEFSLMHLSKLKLLECSFASFWFLFHLVYMERIGNFFILTDFDAIKCTERPPKSVSVDIAYPNSVKCI